MVGAQVFLTHCPCSPVLLIRIQQEQVQLRCINFLSDNIVNQMQRCRASSTKQLCNQHQQQHKSSWNMYRKLDRKTQFVVHLVLVKQGMNGTSQEKQKQLRKRINKFFEAGEKVIDLEKHQYFCAKRQPAFRDLVRSNELIVYGIDFLSNKDMRKRLEGLNPKIVKLDDSHYKIEFPSDSQAKEAIRRNMLRPEELDIKMEQETGEAPRQWFEWKSYKYMLFDRKLQCRYATENENLENAKESECIAVYQRAQKQFEESINSQGREIINRKIQRDQDRRRDRTGSYRGDHSRSYRGDRRDRDWSDRRDRDWEDRRDRSRSKYRNQQNQFSRIQNSKSLRDGGTGKNHDYSYALNSEQILNDEEIDLESVILSVGAEQLEELGREFENLDFSNKQCQPYRDQSQLLNEESQSDMSYREQGQSPQRQSDRHNFSYSRYLAETERIEDLNNKTMKSVVIQIDSD